VACCPMAVALVVILRVLRLKTLVSLAHVVRLKLLWVCRRALGWLATLSSAVFWFAINDALE